MDARLSAELLSRDGTVLARGRIDPAAGAWLAFDTDDGSPRLVSYFFLARERSAQLRVAESPPMTVRLDTHWAGGCRRWKLLPEGKLDLPQPPAPSTPVRSRLMTIGGRLPLGRGLRHVSPFHR